MASVEDLLRCSLAELTERFITGCHSVPTGLLEALEADTRQGARTLARRLRTQQGKNRAEGQRLRHLLRYETELWEQGHTHIAGVDEAGRGPLAGPVVAAAAILPRGWKLEGLDDSKKIGDEARREELAEAIKRGAVAWAVGSAEAEEIDRLNIRRASLLAMHRAIQALGGQPDYVLLDAFTIPECTLPQRGSIKGDALSLSIAAASVLAKTARDRTMRELDVRYPGYGLADHKGYPTASHVQAIRERGVLPIPRRTFAPVREALQPPRPPPHTTLLPQTKTPPPGPAPGRRRWHPPVRGRHASASPSCPGPSSSSPSVSTGSAPRRSAITWRGRVDARSCQWTPGATASTAEARTTAGRKWPSWRRAIGGAYARSWWWAARPRCARSWRTSSTAPCNCAWWMGPSGARAVRPRETWNGGTWCSSGAPRSCTTR